MANSLPDATIALQRVERDTYRLSTGREFYANCGIVGLSPSFKTLFAEGYDGHEYVNDEANPWTREERHELAAFMIALWQAWADAPPDVQDDDGDF